MKNMTTMRSIYRGLHSLVCTHRYHKWGIRCSLSNRVDHASSLADKFSAVSICDGLRLPNQTLHTISQRLDPLDKINLGPGGSGKSMTAMKKQMKIIGCGIPEGSRAMSSDQEDKEFTLFIGTWNVTTKPPLTNLDKWLLVDKEPPDIYAIGLQEVDEYKDKVIYKSQNEKRWHDKMYQCLLAKTRYSEVMTKRLNGMLINVYIKEQHRKEVSRTYSTSLQCSKTYLKFGDKGAVCVTMRLHNTSLCFINSYLSAGSKCDNENREGTYWDITEIMHRIKFNDVNYIHQHDTAFWFGHMNYRLWVTPDEAKPFIDNKKYEELILKHDEFYKWSEPREFSEGKITFPPSYKPETDHVTHGDKIYIPGWRDRILHYGSRVKQVRYDSHPEQTEAELKPVSSLFKIRIRMIKPD